MESRFRPGKAFFSDIEELHRYVDRVSDALVNGKSVQEIAEELELSLSEFVDLIFYLTGRYGLLTFRVYFAISPLAREILAKIQKRWPALADSRNLELVLPSLEFEGAQVEVEGVFREEIVLASICEHLLNVNAYGLICTVEDALGTMIRSELQLGYGDDWWREGVPVEIRKTCSILQEEDPDPAEEQDKYEYWTISHMASILDYRWAIFSKVLPKSITTDKKDFLSKLKRLNRLRNHIMHPIKNYNATKEDLILLEEVWHLLVFDYLGKSGKLIPSRYQLDLILGEDTE
jgi:hypothetical protein